MMSPGIQHVVRTVPRFATGLRYYRIGSFTPRALSVLALLALLPCGAACNQEGYPLENTWHYQGKAPSGAPSGSTFAYRYPDVPPVLDAAGLQDIVSQYRHRVVLLDFWASWSRQNREELMTLARLQNDLRDEGFQVIACNLDPESEWARTTVPILHGASANFPCVIIDKNARADVRTWLAAEWNYELPARFLVSRSGVVAMHAYAGTPLDDVEREVRDHVRNRGRDQNRLAQGEVALRVRLVNVASGQAESLGEVVAARHDLNRLTAQAVSLIARSLDRSANPRIGVAPFAALPGRGRAGTLGMDLSEHMMRSLRDQGYFDLIEPQRVARMLDGERQSVVTVEYDPSAIQGRIAADYLVLGWLRGDLGEDQADAALAGDPRDEQP